MFDLIIGGKKYPVADNHRAAKAVADLQLKEKLRSPELAYVAEAFSVATGKDIDESFEILKNASPTEISHIYIEFIKYCHKLNMSANARAEYEEKFNALMKNASSDEEVVSEKKPSNRKRATT